MMGLTPAQLLLGLLFGMIGMAMFMYGKKTQRFVPLGVGLALMVFPYLITNAWLLLIVGVGLTSVPFFIRE